MAGTRRPVTNEARWTWEESEVKPNRHACIVLDCANMYHTHDL